MEYVKLMRVKHYVKNILIFLPIFFNKTFFQKDKFIEGIIGFICFCLISSGVYILNDIKDVEKDRKHPKKKNRPIASGKISVEHAIILMAMCLIIAILLSFFVGYKLGILLLILYFGLNVVYSLGLKNYPIIDVVILASGFVIRVVYGGVITGIIISKWLYLVVVSGALFMGLGKRRNELKTTKNTRDVLKYYNEAFLDKNMYVSIACLIVFYALWTMESINPDMAWTVPFFIVILMKYSYNIEGESDGDPVEVLLHDKILIALTLLYVTLTFTLLYF